MLLVVGIGFILYQIIKFKASLKGTKSKIKQDLAQLKEQLSPLRDSLIPVDIEELKLMSLFKESSIIPDQFSSEVRGKIKSIYNENLFLYAIKDYQATERSVILVYSKKDTWLYESEGFVTQVSYNGNILGEIHPDGTLQSSNKKILGSIQNSDVLEWQEIKVTDKVVAVANNPLYAEDITSRAFLNLEPMDALEKDVFLSLALLNIVQRSNRG